MRPTMASDGYHAVSALLARATQLHLEPTSFSWTSRVGISIAFTERVDGETFVEALAADKGVDTPPAHLFGDVERPQVSWRIDLAGWEINVYARNAS